MKQRSTSLISGLLISSLLLPSCATIINTPYQTVQVTGQPAGSTIYVNDKVVTGKPVAGTPDAVRLRLPRRRNAEIKVKHEGHKDYTELLQTQSTGLMYLNYGFLGIMFTNIGDRDDSYSSSSETLSPGIMRFLISMVAIAGAFTVDGITGANHKFDKKEIHPIMPRRPSAVAGSQTVQSGPINVRIKGGDKMGNLYVMKESREILYFGKSLDVNSDNLRTDVNNALRDLGYTVPESTSKSVFAQASSARYSIQGEMRDIKYDINATTPYARTANYETSCTVEVTWKLMNQNRQTIVEAKTAGNSVRFEEGGSSSFEDAFENSLYAFMSRPEVAAALAKPNSAPISGDKAGAPADAPTNQLAAITIQRAKLAKPAGDNGLGTAAKSVVTIEVADGHGSGCLISADGYLITNAHVVGEEETVKVRFADGIEATGKVVRVNTDMDLALVKTDVDGLTGFQLPTGSAADLGSDVFAIGTPADKELGQSITKGIVSGRRKIEGHSFLQTDVSINGGNSGGALVTRTGQLVGIVNAKLVGKGIEGIGFAIPAEQVSEALQLKFVD